MFRLLEVCQVHRKVPLMSVSPRQSVPAVAVRPRVKLWLQSEDGNSVLCSGLYEMLQAVEETGSLKHAAARVDRSYRFVWARIREAEQSLGATLVEARLGGSGEGRSRLTPLAVDLLREFGELREQVFRLVDDVFAKRIDETLARHTD